MLRKKLALLLSTSFKDVILNGVSPLSLPNAQANGLGYIKLFGKAENLNLINKNTMTPNVYINVSGVFVNSQNLDVTDYIEVTAGQLYHYTATSYGTSPCLAYYDANKELLGTIVMSNVKDYTPTSDTKYVRLSIYKTTLEVASFSEDVSPTNPVPIMCNNGAVGWTIEPVNLINKNTLTPDCYINTNGDIVINRPNLDVTDYIEVSAGRLYHYYATTYGTSPCMGYYDENKSLLGTVAMSDTQTYTPTAGTKYVRLSIYKTSLEVASFTQDVSPTETISMNGQMATAQNLLSCDDYKDEQNITTGEVVRNVGYLIINGTENWLSYSTTSAGYVYRRINTQADPTTFDIISTHFRSTTRAIANMVIGEARCVGQSIYVCVEQDTVENFKTWLANQSTNGTPVVFVYAKATPTTETVTPQTNIQTVAGNNTLTITQAAVDMLKMEVKYKAKG